MLEREREREGERKRERGREGERGRKRGKEREGGVAAATHTQSRRISTLPHAPFATVIYGGVMCKIRCVILVN